MRAADHGTPWDTGALWRCHAVCSKLTLDDVALYSLAVCA